MNWGKKYFSDGFTLTELMVSLVISGVVMTGVYAVFSSQQKSYSVQDQLAEAHQNLRAAMNLMVNDIRMAGYDPHRNSGAGIEAAEPGLIRFTLVSDSDGYDNDNDGVTDEIGELKRIQYSLYESGMDADSIKDDLGRKLGAGSNQPVAQNIEALDFVYLDGEGKALEFPILNLLDIRAVQITMVASVGKPDATFKNESNYLNQQEVVILPAKYDGYRRKRLSEQVKCRNLAF